MLRRYLSLGRRWPAALALSWLGLARCGGGGDEPTSRSTGVAVVGGTIVDADDSPILYLRNPAGECTAVLLADRLAVTSRHCVAFTPRGAFSCTPSGELVLTGSGAGEIGADRPPSSLQFYTAAHVRDGTIDSVTPDAVGARILSTQTPTSCRDDLAFVVLDRPVVGRRPVAVRLNAPPRTGESVSVAGYGLTERLEPLALRMLGGVTIVGVGPLQPSADTQVAPVRSVRLDSVTCQGDSGGPVLSASGALLAVISLGDQAGPEGPFCSGNELSRTVAPRLDAYRGLALEAYAAAGATPIEEGQGGVDGGSADAAPSATDAALDPSVDAGAPNVRTSGGGCSLGARTDWKVPMWGVSTVALALMAAAGRRRRK